MNFERLAIRFIPLHDDQRSAVRVRLPPHEKQSMYHAAWERVT